MTTEKEKLFRAVDAYREEKKNKPRRVIGGTDYLQSIARILREEYDWMDSMPLDGWIWELLRRTPKYRSLASCLAGQLPADGRPVPWRESQALIAILIDILGIGILPRVSGELEVNLEKLIIVREEIPFYRGPRIVASGYPHPSCEYREFVLARPLIDLRYFRVYTYEQVKKSGLPDHVVAIETLQVGSAQDTIYVGVSRFAKKSDLRAMCADLSEHLTPRLSRKRPDAWKHYLIVYDLREHKCEYLLISELLQIAYPRKFRACTEQDVRIFFKNAVDLIEKDNYREFLPF